MDTASDSLHHLYQLVAAEITTSLKHRDDWASDSSSILCSRLGGVLLKLKLSVINLNEEDESVVLENAGFGSADARCRRGYLLDIRSVLRRIDEALLTKFVLTSTLLKLAWYMKPNTCTEQCGRA